MTLASLKKTQANRVLGIDASTNSIAFCLMENDFTLLMEYYKPLLTENTTKYYIKNSLKEVRQFKNKYITIIVNLVLFLLFVGITTLFLYYKYKGKPNKEEIKRKENQQKQYLFEKLHKISYEKRTENQSLITDLPII